MSLTRKCGGIAGSLRKSDFGTKCWPLLLDRAQRCGESSNELNPETGVGEGTLLIRSDASIAIGTGHAMRCLALAQAWQDAGGHVVFAMAEATPAVRARLVAESCEVVSISHAAGTPEDWGETIALARLQHAEWVVVDGYQFTTDYQQALKAAGLEKTFFDEFWGGRESGGEGKEV